MEEGPASHVAISATVETHTMGASLHKYLDMKVHEHIEEGDWKSILVRGGHNRQFPFVPSLKTEKRDKPFNWQRPTTSIDGRSLTVHCFPGSDYVKHYAAIIATYLSLAGKDPSIVSYVGPIAEECIMPLLQSNLRAMGAVDVVVLGYVHELRRFHRGDWHGDESQLFSWQIYTGKGGRRVALLGCRICFWGDIAGRVVRVLKQLNDVKCVLYIGKLGSTRSEHVPNTLLATGNSSNVQGQPVCMSYCT
jgi:hypothetical protein